MPRYFFHLWDGRSLRRDRRGKLFPTLIDAVSAAGAIVKDSVPDGTDLSGHVVQVAGQKSWLAVVPLGLPNGSGGGEGSRGSGLPSHVDPAQSRRGPAAAGVRTAFAGRIEQAMVRKGWSISETARQASRFLSDGHRFGRAHVWHYVRGKAVPRAHHLDALVRALDLEPSPMQALPGSGNGPATSKGIAGWPGRSEVSSDGPSDARTPILKASDAGEGAALLNIRAVVPWPTALEVLDQLGSVLER